MTIEHKLNITDEEMKEMFDIQRHITAIDMRLKFNDLTQEDRKELEQDLKGYQNLYQIRYSGVYL